MRTSGEHRNQPLDRNGQRASAPNRFFFGIAQRKSLAKRKASCRGTIFFPLTGNIDEASGNRARCFFPMAPLPVNIHFGFCGQREPRRLWDRGRYCPAIALLRQALRYSVSSQWFTEGRQQI
jgi:hypothetical protein